MNWTTAATTTLVLAACALFGPLAIQWANDTRDPPDNFVPVDQATVGCSEDALRALLLRGESALARRDYATASATADLLIGKTDTSPGVGSLMSTCRPPINSLAQVEGLYLRARAEHGRGRDDAARSPTMTLLDNTGTFYERYPALMIRLYPKARILYRSLGCNVPTAAAFQFYGCAPRSERSR